MQRERNRQREEIERSIERIPSLSNTVNKVLDICSRTDTSPNELHQVISLDPVLTGQVLRLVNSAYFALVNQVTSLTRAITMLGMNTVKNMALSTAVINTMRESRKSNVLPAVKFWTHSIAAGVSARMLGEMAGLDNALREELFLAGLLHDLGKVPYGDEYADVIELTKQKNISITCAEREVVGIDHQQVGRLIAEKWQLNKGIRNCIACHHDIEQIAALGSSAQFVAIVALADFYVNLCDYGYAGNDCPNEKNAAELLQLAGVTDTQLCSLGERVEEEIIKAEIFLKV